MLFTELPLTDSLLEGLDVMNFKEATPVQEQAIPIILNNKDVKEVICIGLIVDIIRIIFSCLAYKIGLL